MDVQFLLNDNSIKVLKDGEFYFTGKFKRKWFIFGDFRLIEDNKSNYITYNHVFTKNFSYNCKITIKNIDYNGGNLVLNYVWKRPNIRFQYGNDKYLIIFHKRFRISIFKSEDQIGSIVVPKMETFKRKKYLIKLVNELDLSFMIKIILGVIYKLEIVDKNDDDPGVVEFSFDSLGPLQSELQEFDETWY